MPPPGTGENGGNEGWGWALARPSLSRKGGAPAGRAEPGQSPNVGASAVSYTVNGKQYVAVATGAAAPPDGTPLAPGALRPGGTVVAFALPQ